MFVEMTPVICIMQTFSSHSATHGFGNIAGKLFFVKCLTMLNVKCWPLVN